MRIFSRIGALVLGTAGLLASAHLQAAKPKNVRDLAPAGKWHFAHTDKACEATRAFGAGDETIALRMARAVPTDRLELTLAGTPLRATIPLFELMLSFDAGEAKIDAPGHMSNAGTNGGMPALIADVRLDNRTGLSSEEAPVRTITPAQEAAVTSVTFRAPSGRWFRLQTGSLKALMALMRTCTDDLVKSWGYDPAVQKTLLQQATPIGRPQNWFSSADYPFWMLVKGQFAIVNYRLDVDEAGAVVGCHIIRATMPQEASDLTCQKLTRNARFTPALDTSGKPLKSYFTSKVRFIIR